jgi:murein DD-endopeptidase MepM/ murein hydrolase activator NlpD
MADEQERYIISVEFDTTRGLEGIQRLRQEAQEVEASLQRVEAAGDRAFRELGARASTFARELTGTVAQANALAAAMERASAASAGLRLPNFGAAAASPILTSAGTGSSARLLEQFAELAAIRNPGARAQPSYEDIQSLIEQFVRTNRQPSYARVSTLDAGSSTASFAQESESLMRTLEQRDQVLARFFKDLEIRVGKGATASPTAYGAFDPSGASVLLNSETMKNFRGMDTLFGTYGGSAVNEVLTHELGHALHLSGTTPGGEQRARELVPDSLVDDVFRRAQTQGFAYSRPEIRDEIVAESVANYLRGLLGGETPRAARGRAIGGGQAPALDEALGDFYNDDPQFQSRQYYSRTPVARRPSMFNLPTSAGLGDLGGFRTGVMEGQLSLFDINQGTLPQTRGLQVERNPNYSRVDPLGVYGVGAEHLGADIAEGLSTRLKTTSVFDLAERSPITRRFNRDPLGVYGTSPDEPSDAFRRITGGRERERAGVVREAELGLQAEAERERALKRTADAHTTAGVAAQKHGDALAGIDRQFFRSLIVYGLLWEGVSRLTQVTSQWVSDNLRAEASLRLIEYTTGRATREVSGLINANTAISAVYGQTPEQSLPASVLASRAAPQDFQRQQDFVRRGAQLALITGIDQETSTRAAITLSRQWNLTMGETGQILDVVATAFKNTIVPMDEVVGSLIRLSPFGREANLTLKETSGLLFGMMEATGRFEPGRIESMLEAVSGVRTRPQSIRELNELGLATRDLNGEFLSTPQLLEQTAAAWDRLSQAERANAVIALVGRRYLSEGLDLFTRYDQVIETQDKFNNSIAEGNDLLKARNDSLAQMFANIAAGIQAWWTDPTPVDTTQDQHLRLLRRSMERETVQAQERQRLEQESLQAGAGSAAAVAAGLAGAAGGLRPSGAPAYSARVEAAVSDFGEINQAKVTSARFAELEAEATAKAAQSIRDYIAAQDELRQRQGEVALSSQERAAIETGILDATKDVVGIYTDQENKLHIVKGLTAEILQDMLKMEKAEIRLPNLQTTTQTGAEVNATAARARALGAQFRQSLAGAGYPVAQLDEEWKNVSIAILTSDRQVKILTGSTAALYAQALSVERSMKNWQPPSFQVTDMTPAQLSQNLRVANAEAQRYVQQILASNLPLEQQQAILAQVREQWNSTNLVVRTLDGQLWNLMGPAAAFLGIAQQITAQWNQAQAAMAQAMSPQVQQTTNLNAGNVGQFQQWLTDYENLLRAQGVQQTPQDYLIFGANGFMARFTTSSDAMSMALALLGDVVASNTDAVDSNTEKVDESLRGSYNIPTEFGYRPPTPWSYYKTGAHDMGPINYPWMFPDQDDGGGGRRSPTVRATLGGVPTGLASFFQTTFGKSAADALMDKDTLALSNHTDALNSDARALLDRLLGTGAGTEVPDVRQHLIPGSTLADSIAALVKSSAETWQFPLRGQYRISQDFGERPDYYKQFGLAGHEGVDIAATAGTNVYAAGAGTVKAVAANAVYGNYVIVQHMDGAQTLYAHLQDPSQLGVGQAVDTNTVLGAVGATGNSTGPHLHFGYKPPGADTTGGYKGWEDPMQLFSAKTTESASALLQHALAVQQATGAVQAFSSSLGGDPQAKPGATTPATRPSRFGIEDLSSQKLNVNGVTELLNPALQTSVHTGTMASVLPGQMASIAVQNSVMVGLLASMLGQLYVISAKVAQPPIVYVSATGQQTLGGTASDRAKTGETQRTNQTGPGRTNAPYGANNARY